MRDLTAQVTSSLLPFPGVTIDALGEDEIILDSVLQGKFTIGKTTFTITTLFYVFCTAYVQLGLNYYMYRSGLIYFFLKKSMLYSNFACIQTLFEYKKPEKMNTSCRTEIMAAVD